MTVTKEDLFRKWGYARYRGSVAFKIRKIFETNLYSENKRLYDINRCYPITEEEYLDHKKRELMQALQ